MKYNIFGFLLNLESETLNNIRIKNLDEFLRNKFRRKINTN